LDKCVHPVHRLQRTKKREGCGENYLMEKAHGDGKEPNDQKIMKKHIRRVVGGGRQFFGIVSGGQNTEKKKIGENHSKPA